MLLKMKIRGGWEGDNHVTYYTFTKNNRLYYRDYAIFDKGWIFYRNYLNGYQHTKSLTGESNYSFRGKRQGIYDKTYKLNY